MNSFNHNSGHYLDIQDAKIYYEETGNPDKPVLLLLHGGFGTIDDFNTILPILQEHFRVIGIDSRAQGKSTKGKDKLTYELLQHDVEAVLKYLNIKELSIIGFSDGGIIGYRLAAFSSLKITKLITIGSRWNINDTLLIKDVFLKITPESWKQKFPETFNAYQKYNLNPDFDDLTKQLVNMWLDPNESGQPNEHIQKIKCLIMVVRGDEDHLFSITSATNLTEKVENAVFFNIPFAGHGAFTDQPEMFEIALKHFLIEQ